MEKNSLDLLKQAQSSAADQAGLQALMPDPEACAAAAWVAAGDPDPSGPLSGRLLVVKDNIDVAGWPTRAASPALRSEPVQSNAPVVQRLIAAGGRVLGKANMHELAFGITSRNEAYGYVANPRLPGASAGGSSGGSAAAVAAGIVSMAIGTDTGGSVRIPAALCGVVGLRPSTGRYPSGGVVPLAASRDVVGPIASTVAEIRQLDRVMARAGPGHLSSPRPTLGVPRGFLTKDLDCTVRHHWELALTRIANAGWQLVEVEIDGLLELIDETSPLVTAHELSRDFAGSLLSRSDADSTGDFTALIASPDVRNLFEMILQSDARETRQAYQRALEVLIPRMGQLITTRFQRQRLDAWIFPTLPLAPFPIDLDQHVDHNGDRVSLFRTAVRNLQQASLLGMPSLSLPFKARAGEPSCGLCLESLPGQDDALLELGERLEALLS